MRRVTRDDIVRAVGPVDDVSIAEIIGTGATVDELTEAQAWMINDEPFMNAGKPLPNGRVGALVQILTEFEPDEDNADEGGPVTQATK
jgi:hypothetical protein